MKTRDENSNLQDGQKRSVFRRSLAASLAIALLSLAPATRAEVNEVGVLSAETNHLNSSQFHMASISVSGPIPAFDHNFGEPIIDKPFSITWTAPPGKSIEINAPSQFGTIQINFRYFGGTIDGGTNPFTSSNTQVTLSGVTAGVQPPLGGGVTLGGTGADRVAVSPGFSLDPGETLRFQSLKLTTTVPASFTNDFDNVSISEFQITGEAKVLLGPPGAPGQWVRLVDTPKDPGTGGDAADGRKVRELEKKIAKLKR